MNFSVSYRSEFLKTRRTSSWYLGVLIGLFIPFVLFTDYMFQEDITEKVKSDSWQILLQDGFMLFNLLMLPLFVLLTATLLPQLEFRNNTWKQVLASPQPLAQIFLARYCVLLSMIGVFLLVHNISLVTTGIAIGIFFPQYHFTEYRVDITLMLMASLKTMTCVLAMSAFQFWMGLRFRNFIAPMTIGLVIWIFSNITTFEFRFPLMEFNPFTYLALASFAKYQDKMTVVMIGSVCFCAAFLTLGFYDFRKKRLR